MHFSAMYR